MKNFVLSLIMACFVSSFAVAQQKEKICIDGVCYDVVSTVTVPTVAQSTMTTQEAYEASVIPALKSDTAKFRKQLLEAARLERRSGKITIDEHLKIIRASRDIKELEKMKASLHELAIEDGMASVMAIDWEKLLGFIQKLIPIIIQLIGAFK